MLSPLGLSPSFGFGDRLGLATPGHIASVKGTKFAPIFAQQSIRENDRTGRTPQNVIDDAKRAVDAARWDSAWGADADHLKAVDDLPPFVDAGYTFFTVDPGEHVDNSADTDSVEALKQKITGTNWDELSALYLIGNGEQAWGQFEAESLMRATVKYGKAIQHAVTMYRHLSDLKDAFDFEMSVDETDAPTTPVAPRPRTLYRDTDDKKIAGVCSGLGHYFDIHTTLVRVAFVVFTLLGGAGLLAYAVLWFAVDRGSTPQVDLERSHRYEPNPEPKQTEAA